MQYKDYCETLGVAKDASAEQIKKAFRKLARKHHPDLSQDRNATQRLAELNEANTVMSDPERRAAYDTLGSQPHAHDGGDFQPPPHWNEGFQFNDGAASNGCFSGAEHSDFFEQLFGRGAHRRASGAAGPASAFRGRDQHAQIELDIADAYVGAKRTLWLRGAKIGDDGSLKHNEQELLVKIPKGVFEGQHIRLAGRGGAGSGGAAAGDLYLELILALPPANTEALRQAYADMARAFAGFEPRPDEGTRHATPV